MLAGGAGTKHAAAEKDDGRWDQGAHHYIHRDHDERASALARQRRLRDQNRPVSSINPPSPFGSGAPDTAIWTGWGGRVAAGSCSAALSTRALYSRASTRRSDSDSGSGFIVEAVVS